MPDTLSALDWDILLRRINRGECTPFLGAGACAGSIPLAAEIARAWSDRYGYPLEDRSNLARVAQFVAVTNGDSMVPKDLLAERIADLPAPDFDAPDEPHGILADLPLPVYVTTNYDDFMTRALRSRKKDARLVCCRWRRIQNEGIWGDGLDFPPSPANPVVFHLHGKLGRPESLVLTEDDYLDFLISIWRDRDLLPPRIRQAFTGASLLFLGYGINDWDFRVLWRTLITYLEDSLKRAHISVQLIPSPTDTPEDVKRQVQGYLDRYFGKLDIRVYWGNCREFAVELKRRWELNYGNGRARAKAV